MASSEEHLRQVEDNYDAFQKRLPDLLEWCRGRSALMHDGEIVEFFDTARDAYLAGLLLWDDHLFSVQEVDDTPIVITRNLGV